MTILLQGAGLQTTVVTPVLPTPLLDLEADTLVLSDGDPVSTWADQSINGHDFTSSGGNRPTYHTGAGYPYVEFSIAFQQYLVGGDFADNLSSFTVFVVAHSPRATMTLISKTDPTTIAARGWAIVILNSGSGIYDQFDLYTALDQYSEQVQAGYLADSKQVLTFEMISVDDLHIYTNGALDDYNIPSTSGASNFSTSEPVRIGHEDYGGYYQGKIYAIRIYTPAPDSTQRSAIEAELAARYGITL